MINPGTSATLFKLCCVQPYGVLVYSYRSPRFRLTLRLIFQMSFTKP